ncbi:hypothetical protein GCM10023168_13970 [Fodinibacter luteus]|uniref:ATP-binding protein n=1 Tax=Fodinibacter luteus TaxID=552064 RepID=A0ABP8K9U7_9MICO
MSDARSDKRPAAAKVLCDIAEARYTFGVSDTGEPFALPLDGPRVVRMLRGDGRSLRAELAAAYREQTGAVAPQQALADALATLEGFAIAAAPRALALRVAEHAGALWLDLGDESGDVVRITAQGWSVHPEAPVLHRRTALTAPLPRPATRGDLAPLWELLNVAPEDRAVLLGFLVAALMPEIPHPVLLLTGEQGTGKSTASRMIAATVDPSTVPLRKPPRDLDSWTTAAAGSHVVAVDNLSALPEWLSDALCRASTGDGDVRRKLYSDGDLHVVSFRRVVLLNGIDLGAVRDDLADRLVTVELHRITEATRRRDADLAGRWEAVAPVVLAGLLDLAVRVLAALPTLDLERLPRMADFGRVLAAVDAVMGTDGTGRYRAQAGELANDAVTSDPVLSTLTATIRAPWTGAAVDLLDVLTAALGDVKPPREWPRNARTLGATLKRRAPSLRRLGWGVEQRPERTKRGQVWSLTPPAGEGDETGDEISGPAVSSPSRHPVRHREAPPMTCEDVESAQKGDEVTGKPSNLSVLTEREEKKEREAGSLVISSSRHPDPTDVPCASCGGTLSELRQWAGKSECVECERQAAS